MSVFKDMQNRQLRLIPVVVFFWLGLSGISSANAIQSLSTTTRQQTETLDYFAIGLNELKKGNYAKAFCLWEPLAHQEHAKAQYHLGWLYANGHGLNVDIHEAVYWWKKAAENGFLEAQFAIGLAYTTGEGIKADSIKAFTWFLSAAKQGHEDARDIVKRLVLESGKDYYTAFPEIKTLEWLMQPVLVTGNVVNVRKGPGTKYKIVHKAKKGNVFKKISSKNGWLEVIYDESGEPGWIFSKLTKTVE